MGRIRSKYSYLSILYRAAQGLIIIGGISQFVKMFRGEFDFVDLIIYFILLLLSILGEHYLLNALKERNNEELSKLANLQSKIFVNSEIPLIVINKSGLIKWTNKKTSAILGENTLINANIKKFINEKKVHVIEKDKDNSATKFKIGSRNYIIEYEKLGVEDDDIYAMYLIDCTAKDKLEKEIHDAKTIVGYLCIDNVDEIVNSIDEVRRPMLLAIIDRKITVWFKERGIVIIRTERDKYIFIPSIKDLETMKQAKFDILDEVRDIQVGNELPVTISIGIGHNLETLQGSREDARIALDLAQGRGGDQAIIKHSDKYTFYGGKTKEVEKSTRVKARIKAYAFKELINESEKLIIMGHKNIDMDCLGAAMGVYRGATVLGKKAHIVLREPTFAIQGLYDRIQKSNDYDDLFISPEEAEKAITKDTLLVVVDTHRKSYLEDEALLNLAEKVVVFDHHRRSTDFISEAVLTYIEPFISSTCEMISEILNYMNEKVKLNPIEADALLAGITVDTKNFIIKAGVRTFEAAAYLRRNGADSTRVRLLFQNDINSYKAKADAVSKAKVWYDNMIVAVVQENIEHASIIAAQVADELLNIKNIKASFVFTNVNGCIYISARAISDINVQRIMELLGGGGHLGIAGAQLTGVNMEEAQGKLKLAIKMYNEEGETR